MTADQLGKSEMYARRCHLFAIYSEAPGPIPPYSRIIGEGEMAEMIRRFDWAATPLGPVEDWSDTLVTTVNLLLASSHPMFLWWGEQLIQFYNDSYRPSISDDKHTTALGQRGIECWPEIWHVIGPQIDAVMNRGQSTFNANHLVPIQRNGKLEEVFWTYSYSPVRGSNGCIQGTLVVCSDTTEQVISERRLRTLLAINTAAPVRDPPSESPASLISTQNIMNSLAGEPSDCPFAALYLSTPEGFRLAGHAPINQSCSDADHWPLAKVIDSDQALLLDDLGQRLGDVILDPWPESVTRAYLLPLRISGSPHRAVLVLCISPRLPFDNAYRTFFHLAGSQIANLLQREALQLEAVKQLNALEQQAAVLAEKADLLDLTQDAILMRDLEGRISFWNRGAEAMYGWTRAEAIGRNSSELLKTELDLPDQTLDALVRQGQWEGEATQQKRDGTRIRVSGRCAVQRDQNGNPIRILAINREITARIQAEAQLGLLTERLSLATAVAKIGVWEWDLATNVLTWDATMFAIYGSPVVSSVTYENWSAAVHPEDLPTVEGTLRKIIDERGRGSTEFRIILADGSIKNISGVQGVVLDESGNVIRMIGVNIDVTERTRTEDALRKSEADMTHAAEHDFLTGLPNRMLLHDRLQQSITMGMRHGKKVALLFLDLDGFKHINDSLGHSIGDKLLQSVAQRLVGCIRASDTVSRQGGDEFIVLLSEVEHPEDTAIAARRILEAVGEVHSIDNHDLHVTTSIGVSVFPEDGRDAETLIRNADTAMYQAKENGRHGYRFFKQDMNVKAVERQSIEENLRRTLERQEFALHYQPKIDLKTGRITGAEALLRWTHPTRGPISPAQFIPIAEDSGLILPIGNWVLREACQQARSWMDAGLYPGKVAVNISAIEFRNENFLEALFAILESTHLDPTFLELEMTESVLMTHVASTETVLSTLRASGVHLAVDDFGTGYSSLSYLRRFPLDSLKIDQSFVRRITMASGEAAIVTAIIGMGRNLNLRVVAEGVETAEELAFLKAQDCDEGQGYYFSRPVPAQQFARLLETGLTETSHDVAAG